MLVVAVNKVFVHLVGDCEGVVTFAKVGNRLQLCAGENLACGVMGCVDDYRSCAVREKRFEEGCIEGPIRRA